MCFFFNFVFGFKWRFSCSYPTESGVHALDLLITLCASEMYERKIIILFLIIEL